MYRISKLILYILFIILLIPSFARAGDNHIPVRVGISNTNFNTYLFQEIEFYDAKNLDVMDSATGYVVPLKDNSDILKVASENNLFRIYIDNELVARNLTGPILVRPKENCFVSVKGLKRKGKQALYRGYIELVRSSKDISKFAIVNVLSLKNYLRGVVPNEMPVRFGLEALKAQTVAARNYAVTPRVKAYEEFDLCDSVACQVYFGANTEEELADRAIEETNGIIALDKENNPILALYSSTAGGYTESYSHAFSDPLTKEFPSKEKPYLKAVPDIISQSPLNTEEAASAYYKSTPDAYDIRSPYFRWTKEWNAKELHDVLQNTLVAQSATGFVHPAFKKGDKLDDLVELKVLRRGDSGKIVEMEVITRTQKFKIFKELVVRRLLTKDGKALPSANVVFDNILDDNGSLVSIKAYGGGFGHGVGMSQYGAGFMGSELKRPYEKILQHYYTGITLATKPVIISGNNTQSNVTQNFYTKDKYAHVIIDNKFQASKIIINVNGKENCYELPTNLIGSRVADIDISNLIKKGRNTVTFVYPPDEGSNKAIRLYVELVKKNDNGYVW